MQSITHRTHSARTRSAYMTATAACVLLALLCALSLGALLPSPAAVAAAPFPLPDISNGYRDPDLDPLDSSSQPSLAEVVSPAALAGWFAFAPAPFTGPVFLNASCTEPGQECRRFMKVLLLNRTDDPFGCTMHARVTSGGEEIAGHMLLVERNGGCFFGTKSLNAEALGAEAIMHTGCDPAPPSNCSPGLTITYAHQNLSIPTPYMQYADSARWRAYLRQRDDYLSGVWPVLPLPGEPTYTSWTESLVVAFPASGPLVPEEVLALRSIVEDLLAQEGGGVDDYTLTRPGDSGWTSLRGWESMVPLLGSPHPPADPCLVRVVGLWCEHGHVVGVWVNGVGGPVFTGSMPPGFGSLPRLRALELGANDFRGPLSSSLCALDSLAVLSVDLQSDGVHLGVAQGLTSLPECLGDLPRLASLSAQGNLISNFPSTLSTRGTARRLRVVVLASNNLTSVPASFSSDLSGLAVLDLSSNPLLGGSVPSFEGWSNLTMLDLGHCVFSGAIPERGLDGLSSLEVLDLSNNALHGELPNLLGAGQLVEINLNNNAFSAGVPLSWGLLDSVLRVRLQYNQLSAPMNALGQMMRLQSIQLQNNLLYAPQAAGAGDIGTFVTTIVGNNIVDLNLDDNLLEGGWQAGLLTNTKQFDSISLVRNKLARLPTDMWLVAIRSWDVSFNAIEGSGLPTGVPTFNTYINLQGNPLLSSYPLPTWLQQSGELQVKTGTRFLCQGLEAPALKGLVIEVDPTFTKFRGCQCVPGAFGDPPLCDSVPESAVVSPVTGFSSGEVGQNFPRMINTTTRSNSTSILMPQAITDQWYGNQRLTLGVSTSFYLNLRNIFLDTESTARANSTAPILPAPVGGGPVAIDGSNPAIVQLYDSEGNVTYVPSVSVGPRARFQPVRILTIQLHISRDLFTSPSDVLFVYEGDPSLSGSRVANVVGTDRFSDPPLTGPTTTPAYLTAYGAQLAEVSNRTLVEVTVFSSAASLHFASRDTSGTHFFATYSFEFSCVPATLYAMEEDDAGTHCAPRLPLHTLSPGIRVAVYVVASLCLLWIGVHFVLLRFLYWKAPLYRAASRAFLMLLLAMLAAMSLGAMLYAAVPSADAQGSLSTARAICVGRVWLSCLPLAAILGILFAKTNRVEHIFTSMSLLKVENVSDGSIVKSVTGICAIEVLLLLVFSFVPMSQPTVVRGTGNLNGYMLTVCSLENGAYEWLAVQILFFAILMLAAGALAFRTRNLPSAFNESVHIANCILVLIFFCAIIVPLDFFNSDQPESAVLLQGLGQSVLVLLITSILFAPKMYTVLTRDFAAQKQLMTQIDTTQHTTPVHSSGATVASPRPPLPLARAPSTFSRSRGAISSQPGAGPAEKPAMPRAVSRVPATTQGAAMIDARASVEEGSESAASSFVDPARLDAVELRSAEGPNASSFAAAASALLPPSASFGDPSFLQPHLQESASRYTFQPSSSPPSDKAKGQLAQMLASQSSSHMQLEPTQLAARLLGDDRRESDPPPPPPTQ